MVIPRRIDKIIESVDFPDRRSLKESVPLPMMRGTGKNCHFCLERTNFGIAVPHWFHLGGDSQPVIFQCDRIGTPDFVIVFFDLLLSTMNKASFDDSPDGS